MTPIVMTDFSNGSINTTNPDKPYWTGTGVFDKLMVAVNGNIQVQYDTGRLTGAEYADVYLGSMQAAMSEAMKYLLNKQSVEKQIEAQEISIQLSEQQLVENTEKWGIQKNVLNNQLDMSNIDVAYKEANVQKDLEIRDRQIESANADIAFNQSKKLIMEQTRKDNIRAKAAEQFGEFIKYLSAANVVPGAQDFKNMRALITAMNDGISDYNVKATINNTTGTIDTTKDYVKPA